MTSAARQPARVAVDDETWRQFRQVAIVRDLSIAEYLGQLVRHELSRRADRLVAGVSSGQPPQEQALVALADLRQAIDELDGIAGRLARCAVARGGSWRDVASSLRLSPEAARRAYERNA
jgi:hypothetical protein